MTQCNKKKKLQKLILFSLRNLLAAYVFQGLKNSLVVLVIKGETLKGKVRNFAVKLVRLSFQDIIIPITS